MTRRPAQPTGDIRSLDERLRGARRQVELAVERLEAAWFELARVLGAG